MAEKKAQKSVQTTELNAPVEPTYPLNDFIENSKVLGYSKEVVSGALFGCSKTEITKTECETLIENFLGKKVE